jgi:cystathionine beta-lyase
MSAERPDTGYILHHLGEEEIPFHPASPPVYQTSLFSFPSFAALRAAMTSRERHFIYTRGNNPTVCLAEKKIAALEKAGRAKLFSSGSAAISAAVMAFVRSGDHVICVEDCYSRARFLLESYLPRFGVEHTFVEGMVPEQFEAALRPNTRLIYLESPTSFTFKLQDLEAVSRLARSRNIKTVIDSTWATPLYSNPLELGIDLVVHSLSKYLGGHSDLVAGAVAGSAEDVARIFDSEFMQLGAVPDPHMAWLLLRGMRTLAVRMPGHFAGALTVARRLEEHPAVERVIHPFLPSHPQHALARRQMRGGGGLFSLRLKTRDVKQVELFIDSLRLFRRAVSWGGYESLVFPEAARYAAVPPPERVSLIRLHIGLEDRKSLAGDLVQALNRLG